MADFPALPMWTDAILADCGYMSDEKFGAYHRLLYLIWRSPLCKVPNDDTWLAERLNRPIESVRSLYRQFISNDGEDVAEVLCRTDGNWIFQKRLLKEKKYLANQSKKQSEKAKAKWQKEKGLCRGNATCGNAPTPTPTPTPISPKGDISLLVSVGRFEEWWDLFPRQRRGSRQKAEEAYLKALKRATEQEIHDGTRRYAGSREVRDGYAKGAAAWLNDDRWTSDYSSPNGKQPRSEEIKQQLQEWVDS